MEAVINSSAAPAFLPAAAGERSLSWEALRGTSPFPAQLCKMELISLHPSSLQREGGGGGGICTTEKHLRRQPCAKQSQGQRGQAQPCHVPAKELPRGSLPRSLFGAQPKKHSS